MTTVYKLQSFDASLGDGKIKGELTAILQGIPGSTLPEAVRRMMVRLAQLKVAGAINFSDAYDLCALKRLTMYSVLLDLLTLACHRLTFATA